MKLSWILWDNPDDLNNFFHQTHTTPLQNLQPKNPKFPWILYFFSVGNGNCFHVRIPYGPLRESLILPSTRIPRDPPNLSGGETDLEQYRI